MNAIISADDREHATILAALRHWQEAIPLLDIGHDIDAITDGLRDVLTNGGTVKPLSVEEIDSLCERINGAPDDTTNGRMRGSAVLNPLYEQDGEGNIRRRVPAVEATEPALPRVAIIMEGGIVQDVVSDRPDLVALECITVIDYDTDGSDPSDVTLIPQEFAGPQPAYVREEGISKASINIAAIHRETDARHDAIAAGWRLATADETIKGFEYLNSDGRTTNASTWSGLCAAEGIGHERWPATVINDDAHHTDWQFAPADPRTTYTVTRHKRTGEWSGTSQTSETDDGSFDSDAPIAADLLAKLVKKLESTIAK